VMKCIENIFYLIFSTESNQKKTCVFFRLSSILQLVRRETFDDIEETAKEFVADAEYKENTKHKQRRKTFFDEADRLTSGCVTDSTRAISNFFLQRGSRLVGS